MQQHRVATRIEGQPMSQAGHSRLLLPQRARPAGRPVASLMEERARGATTAARGPLARLLQRSQQQQQQSLASPRPQELPAVPEVDSPASPLAKLIPELDVRKKIVLACALGFCLSNMDKTNFTVAIIPMALENGWSPVTAGLVQSAFFYGFLLMQLPGGWLSSKLGGAYVLPRGLGLWSTATAAIPLVAGNLPALCATRAVMGAGEAVAPSSIIDMISRSVPAKERASAVSFAFGGLHVGSIVGLLASPAIIEAFDWPSLFYIFGLAGLAWLAWFQGVITDAQQRDPELVKELIRAGNLSPSFAATTTTTTSSGEQQQAVAQQQPIPYRAFLRSPEVRVLMFTHFCHNWFHYTMLSWLPTYFTSTLSVDLMHAAQTALLPPIAGIFASAAAGTLADRLTAAGAPIPLVRKVAQSIGFLVPTTFLAIASQSSCTPDDSSLVVGCITAALGMSSFSLAGLYCSHGDLSPKYSSALLGMTNVAGSLPGVIGVAIVGALFDQTGDWSSALFLPSAAFMLAGTAVYVGLGKNEAIDFDARDNSEFGWERDVKQWWAANPAVKAVRTVKQRAHSFASKVRAVTTTTTSSNSDKQQ